MLGNVHFEYAPTPLRTAFRTSVFEAEANFRIGDHHDLDHRSDLGSGRPHYRDQRYERV